MLSFEEEDSDPSDSREQGGEANATEAPKKARYDSMPTLEKVVEEQGQHISADQREKLLALLTKHKALFAGKRGEWKGGTVSLKLKEGYKGVRHKPYSIPNKDKTVVKDEFFRQCDTRALRLLSPEEAEEREFCFPAMGIPKKDGTVRLVFDLRSLNSQLVRRFFHLATTNELLYETTVFEFITILDMSIGYLSMMLDAASRKNLEHHHSVWNVRMLGNADGRDASN